MRKLLLSALFVLCAVITTNAESKFWNFSEDQFKELGTITEEITVDGLTINANADAMVAVDANNKSIDDYAFTSRIKLGGSGIGGDNEATPVQRYLAFPVSGNATVTIYGMSSSSGEDRPVIISDGTEIIAEPTLLGASITKQVVNYEGPATTIYIYSRSSGLNFYGIGVDEEGGSEEPIAQDYFWNFSDDMFNALGDITTEITVDGLTIYGAAGTIGIDGNNKSMDDYTFTHRIKLGGGGFDAGADEAVPTKRYLSFAVSGNASITIYGMSSSSGSDRSVIVSDGEKIIGEETLLGASLTKQVITYEGPEATLYVYSRDSGINFYAIGVAHSTTSGITLPDNGNKAVQSVIYYDLTGKVVRNLPKGVFIEKTIYTDGTSSSKKIIKIQLN